jgi:hypothetical protein
MVGWNRRNSDAKARRRRHHAWLESLSPNERVAYDAERAIEHFKNKKELFWCLWFFTPIAFLSLIILPVFPIAMVIIPGVAALWWMYFVDYKDIN